MSNLRRLLRRFIESPLGLPLRPGPMRVPAWLLIAGVACLLALPLVYAPRSAAPAGPTGETQTTTYAASWTLLELQQHLAAGDVAALTASHDRILVGSSSDPAASAGATTGSDGSIDAGAAAAGSAGGAGGAGQATGPQVLSAGGLPALVAETSDGRSVPIALTISYGAAVDILRSLGYERLLTAEALAARAEPGVTGIIGSTATTGNPTSPIGSILGFAAVALLLTGVLLAISRGATSRREGRAGTAFQTILPVRRRVAPSVEAVAPGAPNPEETATEVPQLPRGLVRFDDVAGVEEAKHELTETVEFLRSPGRFARLGAEVPRGVLLYGPPGTGKTMLARAVAGEAGVPFTYASGSDFVEMFVGVGAARVRKLFAAARAHGAGVIFIDEIDAVAKRRSSGGPNTNDEREGTLNALLVEMDGFATDESLVVIAATNRLDTLDAALLRPGRFGRKVHVPLPDKPARRAILGVHATGKPLDPAVDLEAVARRTAGFSGAQLADLLNEAAISAARREADTISPEDVRAGWLKAALGIGRRRSMNERERSIIAAHEAGHAICGRVWGEVRRVEEISLYQHGEALGVTVSSSDDNALPSERDLRALLAALMGGRAAEALLFTEVTGGAANDFEQARSLAARMVRTWGLGRDPETGLSGHALVSTEGEQLTTSVREAQVRAERVILDRAAQDARTTLLAQRQVLDRVSAYLFEQERIDGDEFAAVFEGRLLPEAAAIGAWRAAASSPRSWAEIDAMAEDDASSRLHDAPLRPVEAAAAPKSATPRSREAAGGATQSRRRPGARIAALAGGLRVAAGLARASLRTKTSERTDRPDAST